MLRICLSLILFTISLNAWSNSVQGVRISKSANDTRVVIDLHDAVEYKIFSLANPARLVIDLKRTKQVSPISIPDLSNTPIRKMRHASWDKNTLRMVLDLHNKVRYESQTLTGPNRLVIDLHNPNSQPAVSIKKPVNKPTPVVLKPKAASAPVTTTPAPIKKAAEVTTPKQQAVTVSKTTKTMARRDIIVAIDAGHGGQDSGALGKNGSKEKHIVLAIAKRLAKLVNAEPGMRAYLTRDKDVFLTLRQRIKRARNNKADMFISIHADAFRNTHAKGASVFVLSERGASSEAAQMMADKENAADLAGGISLEDKDDMLASVLLDLSQTASLEASLEVANTILAGLSRVGNVHKKHVESAAFVVLKSPDIPSVLVETAFISNPDEERKLNSRSHQNKLARAILSGISNYFKRNPLPGTGAPQQHIVSRGDTLSTIAQRYRINMTKLKQENKLSSSILKVGQVLLIP